MWRERRSDFASRQEEIKDYLKFPQPTMSRIGEQIGEIYSVVMTGDNKYIISGSKDKSITIWDIETQKLVHRFENAHQSAVRTVAVTGDNKYIISGSHDQTIAIWNVEDKKLTHRFEEAHQDWISSVTVTEDDRYIISGSGDKSIAIWDIETKKLAYRLENAHKDQVRSVVVTKDGQYVVSGSNDETITLWDFENKKVLHRFEKAHADYIMSVSVTGDNKYIVSGSRDKSLAVWSIEDKKLAHQFENAHQDFINSVTITTDNKYIISGSKDKSVAIWGIESKKLIHRFENVHQGNIYSVAVTPNDRYIVSASEDQTIALWDIEDRSHRQQIEIAHEDQIRSVKVTRGNKYIVSGSADKTVAIWDIENKKLIHRFDSQHQEEIRSVVVTRDNKYIISGSADKTIALWDFEQKKLAHKFQNAHEERVNSLAVTEDEKNIVSGSDDKTIAIWSIDNKALIHRYDNAHQSDINSVALTADGKYIVSGSSDMTIAIWGFESKTLEHRFEDADQGAVWSVAIPRNAKYIVSGSANNSLSIWDMENKKLLHRFEKAHKGAIYSLAAAEAEDCQYIFSGSEDETIAIWDIEDKKLIHRYHNVHQKRVNSVAVAEDSKYIVSGGDDKTIALFDIRTPLTNSKDLLLLNSYSKTLSEGLDPTKNRCPDIKDISFLHEMAFLRFNWNFLNFAVFLLPKVRPSDYLNSALEHKVYISLDVYHKTQLHYLLDFEGRINAVVYEFCSLFFKQMSSFMNFDSLRREKLLKSVAKLTLKIFKTQAEISFLGYLKCFVRPAEEIFDSDDFEKLPYKGYLRNKKSKGFIKLKSISVPPNEEYYSVISTEYSSAANDGPILTYELVLLPLDYSKDSTDTFILLDVFECFEVQDFLFFEDPTVSHLIDFLWEKFKGYLHFQVFYFAVNTVFYTLFGIYYQNELISSLILIIVIVMNVLVLAVEGIKASAGISGFFADPWSYFKISVSIYQIFSAILYWTVQGSLIETICTSTSILLLYTQFISTMRVFDPLRNIIRMITEILSDSQGFMVVIFTYVIGLAIAVYHNREAQQDNDGSGIYALNDVLMEMYAFAIGSWSYTEYAGINIAFFLFASFLLPLILLNMLIALMGDTYGRVQDNYQAYDSTERVLMLYELVALKYQFRRLMVWIRGRRFYEEKEEKETFYLLVVKEFRLSDDQIDLKAINDSQNTMKTQIESGMTKLNDKIDDRIHQLKSEMNDKIGSLKGEVGSLKSEVGSLKNDLHAKIDDKIGSLNAKIEHTNKMVSELLITLGKN